MDDQCFESRIRDRLADLGEVMSRPLFGGHGLYWRDVIFAILYGSRLSLKVDDRSQDDFVPRGMGPFRPNERQTLKSWKWARKRDPPGGEMGA